jgi:hypothetical protein
MAYLRPRCLKKIIKITVLNGFDSFLCYLAAKTYGYICLAGSRKFVRSVFIWEQDSALKWLCFRVITCGINGVLALKCSLLPLSTLFHGIYYGNIDEFAD